MGKKTKKAAPKAPQGEAPALTPGTVLRKQDRPGRAVECRVEAEGYS
jgi:hypothetical protein